MNNRRSPSVMFGRAAVVPMPPHEMQRLFHLAAVLRMLGFALMGAVLMWNVRDRSAWVVAGAAIVMLPGIPITWMLFRRTGVLAPYVWLRDLVGLGVVVALVPEMLVPAMMCCVVIMAFNAHVTERRTGLLLSLVAAASMTIGAAVGRPHDWVIAVLLFSAAITATMVPSRWTESTVRRSIDFNIGIADGLGVAMFETTDLPVQPTTNYHVFFGESAQFQDISQAEWSVQVHPDDVSVASDVIAEAVTAGHDYRIRYRQRHQDGTYRWIEEIGRTSKGIDGRVKRLYGLTYDINDSMAADEMLARFDRLVDSLDVGVTVLHLQDADDPTSLTIVYENEATRRLAHTSVVGLRLIDFDPTAFDVTTHRGLGFRVADVALGGEAIVINDSRLPVLDEQRWFSMVVSPLPNRHCAVALHDVTDLMRAHEELERLAFVDTMTGLPNRERLRHLIAGAPIGSLLAVLDLDDFVDINEAFGHACGDQTIAEVARILAESFDGSVIARLGGDEFAVLVPTAQAHALSCAERIATALERPITLRNGLVLHISASIGTSVKWNPDGSPDELLRQADVAMNRAKTLRTGHEAYHVGNDSSAPHRMMLAGEIRRAVREDELEVFYQPIADLESGSIVGVEGSLSWLHPSLGLLGPGQLSEVVGSSNASADLLVVQLERAIRQHQMWLEKGHRVPININVAAAMLRNERLMTKVIDIVTRSGVAKDAIGLEVAEAGLSLSDAGTRASLMRLDDAGLRLILDHFDCSAAVILSLRNLPFGTLKIDRAILGDPNSTVDLLISAIVGVAADLGLALTLFGVDDDESLRWLRAGSVHGVQGDAVHRSASADEVELLLSAQRLAAAKL